MNDGFEGVEAERGPRGGVVAEMVRAVDDAEQRRPVHEPMRPIEPGIVDDDHRDDGEDEVAPPEAFHIDVELEIPGLCEEEGEHAAEAEDGE